MDVKQGIATTFGGALVIGAVGGNVPGSVAIGALILGTGLIGWAFFRDVPASRRKRAALIALHKLRANGVELRNQSTTITQAETADFVDCVNRWEAEAIKQITLLDPLRAAGFRTLNQTTTALASPINPEHDLHWRCHDERLRRLEKILDDYKEG